MESIQPLRGFATHAFVMNRKVKNMESNIHWRYFLSIDEDFGTLSRFIEPCQKNLNAYYYILIVTVLLFVATFYHLNRKSGVYSIKKHDMFVSHADISSSRMVF